MPILHLLKTLDDARAGGLGSAQRCRSSLEGHPRHCRSGTYLKRAKGEVEAPSQVKVMRLPLCLSAYPLFPQLAHVPTHAHAKCPLPVCWSAVLSGS